ncbi:hypothetical protein KEM56_001640 [Ascosphaera pollenicola]|nr:hypothetical protein KEM56_001640 [Ascosphaera pollenicola]
MSVALKLSSLLIRTLSKPIALLTHINPSNLSQNSIKAQAREHERFRRICISFAQGLHRIDMRMRLGLLQSTAAIDRQTRAAAAAELAKKRHHPVPTVKSQAQTQAEQEKAARSAKEKEKGGHDSLPSTAAAESTPAPPPKSAAAPPRIRPLSEAKAIDSGATFLSEAFLFLVGAGLILFESFRARRKESRRRNDVDDRIRDLEASEEIYKTSLIALEKEIMELHRQLDGRAGKHRQRILPETLWGVAEPQEEQEAKTWYTRAWEYAQEASAAVQQRLDRVKNQDAPRKTETETETESAGGNAVLPAPEQKPRSTSNP